MPRSFPRTASTAMVLVTALLAALGVLADETPKKPNAPDRFETIARRYWQVLERRPRFGTAFDHWYRHYLDAGRLDELLDRVERLARENPDDVSAQLLWGLVHDRQGREQAAEEAYLRAEELDHRDFYPPYVRGLLHARARKLEEATAAFRRAIDLNPPRAELLDAYKRLGSVQLQAGHRQNALKTWDELARIFPDDVRVLKELAHLLAEEELYPEAIDRWKRVAVLSRDEPYQRLGARIRIAELETRRGRFPQAVELLEKTLEQVRPDSWIAADVRRRIEEAFRRGEDRSGLIAWCKAWLKRGPTTSRRRSTWPACWSGRAGRTRRSSGTG